MCSIGVKYSFGKKSLTFSWKCAVCKYAGALWELRRSVVHDTKLTGTCRELTSKVSECLRTHHHVCLDCKRDLRKEVGV